MQPESVCEGFFHVVCIKIAKELLTTNTCMLRNWVSFYRKSMCCLTCANNNIKIINSGRSYWTLNSSTNICAADICR